MRPIQGKKLVPVILSGGMGTRLWPLSRGNHPKQFLNLANPDLSLIQETVQRVSDNAMFYPPVIVCNEAHRFLVAEKMREIGVEDATILLEPCGKNTAPAIATAAKYVEKLYGDATLLVLPSDHLIRDSKAFIEGARRAANAAADGYMVTFGITPDEPETGFGYIKMGDAIETGVHATMEFVEKPDTATAQKYVDSGKYAWNSGMFCFTTETLFAELGKHSPQIAELVTHLSQNFDESDIFIRVDGDIFARLPSISIDYAVMEHTEKGATVPLDCGWNDAGSWDALWKIEEKDAHGNAVHGEAYLMDVENSYIACNDGVHVAALGVKDLTIISTKDCIMIADRSRAQDVKKLVEQVRESKPELIENYRQVYRPWGHYDSVDNGDRHQVKRIVVNPGAKLSLQKHYHRSEHWIVVNGTARITRDDVTEIISETESAYIPVNTKHRLENPGKIPLELIEVQSGPYLGEDDIVRYEDSYGRIEQPKDKKKFA